MKAVIKKTAQSVLHALRNFLEPLFRFREIAVLAFHSISDAEVHTAVSGKALKAHLEALRQAGYSFISISELAEWHFGKRVLPRKCVALTFDDGYMDFLTDALPVLERFSAPAALFLVGDTESSRGALDNSVPLLDSKALELVRAHPLVSTGYHSRTHPNLTRLADAPLRAECEPLFNAAYFAYPGGNHNLHVREIIRRAGYRAAFTIRRNLVTRSDDLFTLPRSVIVKNMTPADVLFHSSVALDWYRFLGALFRLRT